MGPQLPHGHHPGTTSSALLQLSSVPYWFGPPQSLHPSAMAWCPGVAPAWLNGASEPNYGAEMHCSVNAFQRWLIQALILALLLLIFLPANSA